jgi:hypothetical protein
MGIVECLFGLVHGDAVLVEYVIGVCVIPLKAVIGPQYIPSYPQRVDLESRSGRIILCWKFEDERQLVAIPYFLKRFE